VIFTQQKYELMNKQQVLVSLVAITIVGVAISTFVV